MTSATIQPGTDEVLK